MADLLVPFVAGQKSLAAALNAAFDITRVKCQTGLDQSVTSSTVFVSSTSLVLPVKASALYVFESQMFFSGSTTGNFKMKLLLPTGATVRLADSTGTSSTSTERAYAAAGSTVVSSESPSGFIDLDTTAGDLTIQFAQNTSTTTATTLKLGSWIRLTQVA